MFNLFFGKAMNKEAAKAFWTWFEEQEAWIIDCSKKSDNAFIWAIDKKLKPIFPYFNGELEFELGYNKGVGEFFFFHLGNKDLIRDGEILGKMMPSSIAKNWKFILER